MRLRLGGGQIEVTCGGMERSVTVGGIDGDDFREVIVPLDVVSAVSKLAGEMVTIETDGTNVVLSTGQTRLSFPLTTNVVAEVPLSTTARSMVLTQSDVAMMASQVAPFASRDGSRPALMAVHLNGSTGQVTSTDSYRFAVLDVDWLDEDVSALIVPHDVVLAASTLRGTDSIVLSVTDRVVRFENDTVQMTSRQQAADVITWANRIPEWDESAAIHMDGDQLKNAMDLVGIAAQDKRAHLINVPGSGVWVVATSHGGTSKVRVDAIGGSESHSVVNVALTESVFARCGSQKVRLVIPETGPLMVRGESDGWIGGVMPMTCSDEERAVARAVVDDN